MERSKTMIIDNIKDFHISCSICTEYFNRPKILPCLHTFCESCLRDYVLTKSQQNAEIVADTFPCPLCQRNTNMPPGGDISSFPDNHFIESLKATIFDANKTSTLSASSSTLQAADKNVNIMSPTTINSAITVKIPPRAEQLHYGIDICRRQTAEYFSIGQYGNRDIDFNNAFGLCTRNPGEIVLSDLHKNRILVLHEHGYLMHSFQCANTIAAVCVDNNANILVAETQPEGGLVSQYKLNGFRTKMFGRIKFEHPSGVAFNNIDHHIVVTSTEPSHGYVLDSTGKMLQEFGSGRSGQGRLKQPLFVIVYGDNANIAVVDALENTVKVFSRSGNFIFQFGKTGSKQGEMCQARGLCTDSSGNFIVCDYGNCRLQRFSPKGKFDNVLHDFSAENLHPQNVAMDSLKSKLYVVLIGKQVTEIRVYPYAQQHSKGSVLKTLGHALSSIH